MPINSHLIIIIKNLSAFFSGLKRILIQKSKL